MKNLFTIVFLFLCLLGCSSLKTKKYSKLYEKESTYKIKSEGQSPFVGRWQWVRNKNGVRSALIDIGERNDSLMIGIRSILDYGNRIHCTEKDGKGLYIPEICIAIPKGQNTINAVFCRECSMSGYHLFDSVTIKLMDNNTLVWSTKKSEAFYVPMQMVLKREHNKNTKFSHNIEAVYIESKKQP